jgi:hypothetical protein
MLKGGMRFAFPPYGLEFKRINHENWTIQRHGYQTPPQARREQSRRCPRLPDLTFICAQKPVDFPNEL